MADLLQGHVALVTGGLSGIGAAIAAGYVREGARVAIADVTTPSGAGVPAGMHYVKLDVRDRAQCHAAAQSVSAALGPISVLVNCAGVARRTAFASPSEAVVAEWDEVIAINLDGVFNVTHACLDQLKATRGRIVNIGSIQSFVHIQSPTSAAYTASKHGVLGFTRALAAELGPLGIRVNAIGPGFIETPLNAKTREGNRPAVERFVDHTPLRRTGQPDDIAGPAIFLASDMAAYVNGAMLMVDGGYRTV